MLPESPVSSKSSLRSSPLSLLCPMEQSDTEDPEEQTQCARLSSLPLSCWATQALCDLALCETDLRRLQERHSAEAEAVGRGLERAILGAQREERRLLERVEQDHRDLQLRLEQLKRENTAAVQAGRALIEQRQRKVSQLREQISKSDERNTDGNSYGATLDERRDMLLKDVSELIRPWEMSLALKRVSFKPSAQPKAVTFGEMRVQDHSVNFPVGGCRSPRQLCAAHATGGHCEKWTEPEKESMSTPDGTNRRGGHRVVQKIKLSTRNDDKSAEELDLSLAQRGHQHQQLDHGERDSSQEDKSDSPTSESKGDELFLAVPELLSNAESDGEDFTFQHNASHKARKQRELAPSTERSRQEHTRSRSYHDFAYEDLKTDIRRLKQNLFREATRFRYCTLPSTLSLRGPISSHSCQDLLSRDRPLSRLSTSLDDRAYNRVPSPAESVDSGHTFVISSSRNYITQYPRLSRSSADLSHLSQPPTNERDQISKRKVTSCEQPSNLFNKSNARASTIVRHGINSQQDLQQHAGHSCGVSRSLSISIIDGSSQGILNQHKGTGLKSKDVVRLWRDGSESAFLELQEDAEPRAADEAHFVRQFGKQGSGRADLTLPSGVHATPQGQLFLVDCGNSRVQITDHYGNVLQQVTSPSNDAGNSRRCRNYFDVAVNGKGLIALSCAAERVLFIFNRHGRLLQSFGGGFYVGGVPRDELEAPRGVTVTQKDEFLVADIRKGTLTAMKLEPKTGSRLERTVVTGFHRPYLVAVCLHTGLVAVSERGSETGRQPCVKVLGPDWNTLRILGVCSGMGPVLSSPWGLCIDRDGAVLVADWAERHRVVLYPPEGTGRILVSEGLNSPRGLALLPSGLLVVSDGMHHCIKIYQYK